MVCRSALRCIPINSNRHPKHVLPAEIVGPYMSVDCENPNELSARQETRSPEGQVEDMGVILSSFSPDVQLHRVHPLR